MQNVFRKSIKAVCYTLIFSGVPNFALGQHQLTMNAAIDSALANNIELKQSILTELSNAIDVKKVQLSQLPNVNFSSNGSADFGRALDPVTNTYLTNSASSYTGSLSGNIIIFQGSQKINQLKANKSLLEANKSATQKIKNDLKIAVVSNYLAILNYLDQLEAANEQRELATQLLDAEQKRYNAGKKSMADVSRAKSQVAKIDLNVVELQNQVNNFWTELKQLMNADQQATFILEHPKQTEAGKTSTPLTQIYQYAIDTLPEIKRAVYAMNAAKYQLKTIKGAYYPTLTANVVFASSYLYQYHFQPSLFGPYEQPQFLRQLNNNKYEYVGLTLSVPIFNGSSVKLAVQKANLNLKNTELNISLAKSNLYKVLNQAQSDLDAAVKIYTAAQENLNAAHITFDNTAKKYKNGASNSFDLNQAQSDFNAAQFTLINAKYDLLLKQKIIDFYKGIPIRF